MNRLKFLAVVFTALVLGLGIYSCGKENSHHFASMTDDANVNFRASDGNGFCDPQTLYPDVTECEVFERAVQITFDPGNTLYCTCSELYGLCPGLTIDVSYIYTSCLDLSGNPIHFIHNLEFDIEAIKAACPAFADKLADQLLTNNHVSFLNTIESDISKQVEWTEAYSTMILNPDAYGCNNPANYVYSIKFIKNTCYLWGIGQLDYPDGSGSYFFFTKEDCGESVCCSRSGFYCYDEEVVPNGSHEYNVKAFGECPEECTNECGNPELPGSENEFE